MSNTFYIYKQNNDLVHYGVLGMKWGVRRYQNKDGSLTAAGRKKYLKGANISRAVGSAIGSALGGPILGNIVGKNAYNTQVQSNIEKDEREYERERVSKMDDKELFEFNQRKNLENQLSDILSKEKQQTGFDYVKDLLKIVSGGANVIKNITDSTVTLSTPSKKDRDKEIENIKAREKDRIKAINDRKEALINEAQNYKNSGKMSGSQLKNAIKKINDDANTDIQKIKDLSKSEKKEYNDRLNLLIKTSNGSGAVSGMTNIASSNISDLARLYNSGAQIDTSNLTNQELQQVVNRARAEQQYLNIVTPINSRTGMQYVSDFVNTAANLTGIGSSTARAIKTFI